MPKNKRKRIRKTITFGYEGELPVEVIQQAQQIFGSHKLSEFIRNTLSEYYVPKKVRIKVLLKKHDSLTRQFYDLKGRILKNLDLLKKEGVDIADLAVYLKDAKQKHSFFDKRLGSFLDKNDEGDEHE